MVLWISIDILSDLTHFRVTNASQKADAARADVALLTPAFQNRMQGQACD